MKNEPLKLNLGCGHNKITGYLNVDCVAEYEPDQLVNLEAFPWPWADNSASEIVLCHVLEHLGESREAYLGIWQELYRVLQPGGRIHITVPHWLHENFAHDPTHVRVITPAGVAMFDNERNQQDFDNNGRETKLGWQLGIDFKLLNVGFDFTGEVQAALRTGEISAEDAVRNVNRVPNFCEQIQLLLEAVKPARGRRQVGDRPFHPAYPQTAAGAPQPNSRLQW